MTTRAEEIETALRRGDRLADGTWPPVPLTWTQACYVAPGMLQGVEGVAAHIAGDTWRFMYRASGPLGRVVEVDVRREYLAV